MLPAHQLQGELAIPVPRYRHRAADEVRGRVHELLQSPARSRAWLVVLDDLPADDELERAGLGWLMGGFPWAHGRTIITTRAAEWVQQGEDSREVSATDLQYCDWCGAGLLTMLKCGKCKLVYYCSIDCQRASWSQHKVACVPKCNMDDVMGLSVGSFCRGRGVRWIKSTVRQCDDAAGDGALRRLPGPASRHRAGVSARVVYIFTNDVGKVGLSYHWRQGSSPHSHQA